VDLRDPTGHLRLDRDDLGGDALADLVEVGGRIARDRGRDRDGRGRPLDRRLRLPVAAREEVGDEAAGERQRARPMMAGQEAV
jgi:hypothetical protein